MPVHNTRLTDAPPSTWGARHAHDPTVVRAHDGTYYMFSTDAVANSEDIPAGVHIRTSRDLVTWHFAGTAFDGVPGPARDWSGATGLWAPEVVRWSTGAWHMYYSASTFGSNTSAIGLATAPHPSGPWKDHGLVVATRAGVDTQNAIDAAVTFDADGAPWLTYGSFFSGIYTLPLAASGRPLLEGDSGSLIARRNPSVEGAVEGAFIMYRPQEGRYVLFASYDSLFSSYNVRVAAAEHITGPYRDIRGLSMTDLEAPPASIGTKILGSHRFDGAAGWLAPGHSSVLTQAGPDGSDEHFLVHHARFAADPSQHIVQLRRLFFNAAGWPVVSPQPYAGREREVLGSPEPLSGRWQVVRFAPDSTDLVESVPLELKSDSNEPFDGVPAAARLRADHLDLDAVVFVSWDWSRGTAALSFSGIDRHGVAWCGTKGA